ncbi:hypothetical protein HDV63DRAFT_219964 [Trichoderma sp. SZMC 28014]
MIGAQDCGNVETPHVQTYSGAGCGTCMCLKQPVLYTDINASSVYRPFRHQQSFLNETTLICQKRTKTSFDYYCPSKIPADLRLPASVLCLPVFSAVSGYLLPKSPKRTPSTFCHVPDTWSGHHLEFLAASHWPVSAPPATLICDLSLVLHIHGPWVSCLAVKGSSCANSRLGHRSRISFMTRTKPTKGRQSETKQSKASHHHDSNRQQLHDLTRRHHHHRHQQPYSSSSMQFFPPFPPLSRASSFSPSAPLSQSGPSPGSSASSLAGQHEFFTFQRGDAKRRKGKPIPAARAPCTWRARGGLKLGRGQCLRTGQAVIHTGR